MLQQIQTAAPLIDGLYGKLVEGGIGYFFPSSKFESLDPCSGPSKDRSIEVSGETSLVLNWLGSRYSLTRGEAFSDAEVKLLTSIGAVLDSRYRMIVDTTRVGQRFELFRGLPEDRYVSAYIDAAPYAEKVCASSGTSALLRQYARSRNIKLSFQTSPYSNCRSCRM